MNHKNQFCTVTKNFNSRPKDPFLNTQNFDVFLESHEESTRLNILQNYKKINRLIRGNYLRAQDDSSDESDEEKKDVSR